MAPFTTTTKPSGASALLPVDASAQGDPSSWPSSRESRGCAGGGACSAGKYVSCCRVPCYEEKLNGETQIVANRRQKCQLRGSGAGQDVRQILGLLPLLSGRKRCVTVASPA